MPELFIIYKPVTLIIAHNLRAGSPEIIARYLQDPSEEELVYLLQVNKNTHSGFTRVNAQAMEVSTLRD